MTTTQAAAPVAALAERVNGLLGGDNHIYFVASGSEANEAAFKTRPEIDRIVDVLDHAIAEAGKALGVS